MTSRIRCFRTSYLAAAQVRAATVSSQTDVNVLMLQRKEFDALLGPLQQLLDAQAATYKDSGKKAGRVQAAVKVSNHMHFRVSRCQYKRPDFQQAWPRQKRHRVIR